jgi:hypothetical protein
MVETAKYIGMKHPKYVGRVGALAVAASPTQPPAALAVELR